MKVQIEIDTTGKLTANEAAILQLVSPTSVAEVAPFEGGAPAPVDAPEAPAESSGARPPKKPTARQQRAAQKAKEEAAKPEPDVEPEPEPEPEEDEDDDILGADEPEAEYTLDDAITRATDMVGSGKGDRAKAVLADLGVKRVSQLDAEGIAKFMAETA